MASKERAAEETGGCNTETEDETIALRKKRSRRVSFAETTAIHLFTRDDEYETPPDDAGNSSSEGDGKLRRKESDEIMELLHSSDDDDEDDNLGALKSSFLRPMESPSSGSGFGSATSNDEDDFFGPVSMDFIRPGRLSDSSVFDENHDITMDSTAFSMHFHSLAKSDSGGDFKTPTGIRLAYDERTSGQISTANSLGDLMDLTMGRKPVLNSSFPSDKVNNSGHSDDMSVLNENSHRYDYAQLPPELDVLLAEGSKDVAEVSLDWQGSSLQKDTVPVFENNGHELSDIFHNKDAAILGVEKASVEAISGADLSFDKRSDNITPAPATLNETPCKMTESLDDDPVTVLPIPDQGTPFDEDGKARKILTQASGEFESPSSRTLPNINQEQSSRSFVVGSVSSLLAKRRKIFKASSNQLNDEWNLILLPKEISDKGSIKHVQSTSRFAKGFSRFRRLETFPFISASKAEGTAIKLLPPRHFSTTRSKNNLLDDNEMNYTVENSFNVPVICLEARFSDVVKEGDSKNTMDNNVSRLMHNKEFARDVEEVKDMGLISCSSGFPFHEQPSKIINALDSSSLPGSLKKRLDHHVLEDNKAKGIQELIRNDSIILDVTFDDTNRTEMSNYSVSCFKNGTPNNSSFSSQKGLLKKEPSDYRGNLSINWIQPSQSHLRLDQDVGQKDTVVCYSGTEDITSLTSDRKQKTNTPCSDFEAQKNWLQNENSLLSKGVDLVTSSCLQIVLDKDSESCELDSLAEDVQMGCIIKEQSAQSTKSNAGSSEGFDGPNDLQLQTPESCKQELSFSRLCKEPCDAVDYEQVHLVGEYVRTSPSNELNSKCNEDDRLLRTESYVCKIEDSSGRKRKHGGEADESENHNDEVSSFRHKYQNHFQEDSSQSCSFGLTKLRNCDDVFTSLCVVINQLLSPSIDKHGLAQIDELHDILVHLEKVKSYEHLYHSICSQKTFDPTKCIQNKRLLDLKSLLYKILYKKANLQLLRLKRGELLGKVQQLNARIQDSETLTSTFFCPRVFAPKDTRATNISPKSQHDDKNLVPAEFDKLKEELKLSDKKIRNLSESFHASFKAEEESTCTNITEHAKVFLSKRISCWSLLSELQSVEVESLAMKNGQQTFIFNHRGFLSQSINVNLSSSSAFSMSKELNNLKISKIFYNMDACTAFSYVFGTESILMYGGLRAIAQETQKTNSLLHTLLDVIEEIELAKMELRNLTHSRFSQPSADRLDLQLCFIDFKSGVRVSLSIDVTSLNRGVYPSDTLPYLVEGRGAGKDSSLEILLSNIKTGLKGLKCGYMRIINLCQCVSKMMQSK